MTQGKDPSNFFQVILLKYEWAYNNDYWYWTMTPYQDSNKTVWGVEHDGFVNLHNVEAIATWHVYSDYGLGVVRPVIVLYKTALGDKDESVIDDNNKESVIDTIDKISEDDKNTYINNVNNSNKNMTSTNVKVDNTYLSQSLIIIILGFIISCASLTLYYIIRKKEGI